MTWKTKNVINSVMQQLMKKAKAGNVAILRDDLEINNTILLSEPRYNALYLIKYDNKFECISITIS